MKIYSQLILGIALCVSLCPVTGAAASVQSLAPVAWTGITRVEDDPTVIGSGISNAASAAGYNYTLSNTQTIVAGALVLRTSDLLPYNHNVVTCRRVNDGAVFTGMTNLIADGAYFPAYFTRAANGNEVALEFVAWTLPNGQIVINSQHLNTDYPAVQGAVDSVTVQLWAVNQSYLKYLLQASLALWANEGKLTFRNATPPHLPLAMIQQARHFPNTLTLDLINYSSQSMPITINVERTLTINATAPVVTTQSMSLAPGASTVQLPVESFIGATIYVVDSSGARDQAFLGRAFQYFTDAQAGGASVVTFSNTGCASGGANTPGTLSLIPDCASLVGTVQEYAGIYLPVGSYVGEVVSLQALGIAGLEFSWKSQTPARVEVEDVDVHDNDYHGVNLPASPQWTKVQVAFKDLTQRGFGAPEPFDGKVINISFLVPPNVQSSNAHLAAFSMAVDAVAFSGTPTTSSTPGVTQTIKFGPLANETLGTGPVALTATATSGLPVEFTSTTPAVCATSQNSVTSFAAGTCSIAASQPGNSIYAAATPVIETFTVSGLLSQKITFAPLSNQALGSPPFALTAVASSGLPVTLVSNTVAVCKVASGNVTLLTTGTCSISASQPGNTTYSVAPVVTQTFAVSAPTVKNPTIHAAVQGGMISGTVTGVTPPQSFRVIVWAETNQFYIQPCATSPLTAITSNGTWGPVSSHNGTIFALLVSASYSPPSTIGSLPAVDGVKVFAATGSSGTVSGSNVVACPAQ